MVNGSQCWLRQSVIVPKKGEERKRSPVQEQTGHQIRMDYLLTRCLNIYIDLLCAAASEKTTPVDKEQPQNDDHEDRQYGDNSRAAAAVAIFSHEVFLLLKETTV
jgi:hypothetical protein